MKTNNKIWDEMKVLNVYKNAAPVLHLPQGNKKLGTIPAFNLCPGITCSACARAWYDLAKKHPKIKFLAFTKAWNAVREIDFFKLENFSLVLSGWPGTVIPEDLRALYPIADCIENENEKPDNALLCPGNCETCGACWALAKNKMNVAFIKH